jgi:pyrroline-5-carboxylate reductase
MHIDYRVGFVGFGHMAKILFTGLTRAKVTPHSHVLFCQRDPKKMTENQHLFGVTGSSLTHLIQKSDLILLCMRPQQIPLFMEELNKLQIDLEGKWFVSILAGTKISYFQAHLGKISWI